MERTLSEDEEKLKKLDAELNKLVRINRQVPRQNQKTSSMNSPDSPIFNIGSFPFNGQLNIQTLRVENPPHHRATRQAQVEPFQNIDIDQFSANNIDVETINGIPFENFVFLQNDGELIVPDKNIIFEGSLQIDGDVILTNDGKVNNIDLSREILAIDSSNFPENLTLENVLVGNLVVESMNNISVTTASLNDLNLNFEDKLPMIKTKNAHVLDNLKVDTINGIKWDEFVRKLVFRDEPSSIDSLSVNGNFLISGDRGRINAERINGIKFPEEFVLKQGPPETVINGKKSFTSDLGELEYDDNFLLLINYFFSNK